MMKKKIIIVSVLSLVILACFVVARYLYPFLVLKNTFQNMKEVKSFSISGSVDLNWKKEKITIMGSGDVKDSKGNFDIHTTVLFIPLSLKVYVSENQGTLHFYSKLDTDSSWVETKVEKSSNRNHPSISYSDIKFQIIDSNRNFVHATVALNSAFKDILASYGITIIEEGELEVWIQQGYLSRVRMNRGKLKVVTSEEIPISGFDINLFNYNEIQKLEDPRDV